MISVLKSTLETIERNMSMKSNNDIIERIQHYMDNGKIAVFVGAGVSRLSGYPSWYEIIKKMANELGYLESDSLSTEDYLKISQMYFIEKSEEKYLETIKKFFDGKYETNEVHDLIFSLQPKHLLTTNYDTLLEKTAVKFGKNYSVINADTAVSGCESNQYIIKLHGDFDEKFVLKEADYLNYEMEYMLIDNIVKSVFATNLVIFIGYSLNDYNIKLIMNWVKNVQADTFIRPIFIHTDKSLSNIERHYQNQRGLEVLDCNDFGSFEDDDYLHRYTTVLNAILEKVKTTKEGEEEICVEKRLDFLTKGISNLQYIRTSDFNKLFENHYMIDVSGGSVVNLKELKSGKIGDENYSFIISENSTDFTQKYPSLSLFVQHCELVQNSNRWYKEHCNLLNNSSFIFDKSSMQSFCEKKSRSEFEKFKKAYYLAQLAHYQESYKLFTELLIPLKENAEWDLYYLAQINRKYLYRIIVTSNENMTGPLALINYRRVFTIYSKEFLKTINQEMDNFDLEQLFESLPVSFKNKYRFLENLCKGNIYIYHYDVLLSEKNKVNQDAASGTRYIAGMSEADKIKVKLYEEVKFAYENMIIFTDFKEYKEYVKTAIITWIEYYSEELSKLKREVIEKRNTCFEFTLADILILSKVCEKGDIEYLKRKKFFWNIDLSQKDQVDLFEYVLKQLNIYLECFKINNEIKGENIILWEHKSLELKNLLQISAYFLENEEYVMQIFDLFRKCNNQRIALNEIIEVLQCMIIHGKLDGERLLDYIEEWLLSEINKDLDNFISIEGLMRVVNTDSKMKKISKAILANEVNSDYLSKMNVIFRHLEENAKNKIEQFQEFGADDLYERYPDKIVSDKNKVYTACRNTLKGIIKRREEENSNGIYIRSVYSDDQKISMVIQLLIINGCNERDFLDQYIGINDEYDYWFSREGLSAEKFDLNWLQYYPNSILDVIKQDKSRREQLMNIMELDRKREKADESLIRRIFYVYRYLRK